MTVSHLFYDFSMVEAEVNYESVKAGKATCPYNVNDPGFKSLMESVVLGTKATFVGEPSDEDQKKFIAAKYNIPLKKIDTRNLTPEEKVEAVAALKIAETLKPMQMRKTVGDASESGLVKFL
jgi:hypothetical protein